MASEHFFFATVHITFSGCFQNTYLISPPLKAYPWLLTALAGKGNLLSVSHGCAVASLLASPVWLPCPGPAAPCFTHTPESPFLRCCLPGNPHSARAACMAVCKIFYLPHSLNLLSFLLTTSPNIIQPFCVSLIFIYSKRIPI